MKKLKKEMECDFMSNQDVFRKKLGNLSDFMVNRFGYKIVKNSGKEITMVCINHGNSQNNQKGLHLRVNNEKSLFFCNVCSGTGNVHTGSYTEVVEACMNLTNSEAYKWLCKEVGINSNEETSIYDIRNDFVDLCHKNLFKYPEALEYLNKRGLSEKTIKRFRIGFSNSDELKNLKYSQKQLIDAGILKPQKNNPNKFYNVFKNRIVSMAGDNIYGRAIDTNNIPHLYSQGENKNALYNKNKAKNKEIIFIVESLFNAWTIEQYIFALCEKWGTIATLGTNGAKEEVLQFIKESDPSTEFIIIPDNDEWFKEDGVKHAKGQIKGLTLAKLIQSLNRSCRVMILDDNSDANDLSKKRVPVSVFRQMVENSVTPFEYAIHFEKHYQDVKSFGGKKAFLEKIKNILKVYPLEIKTEAIKLIASIVGLQEVEVKDYLKDNVKENMVCQYFCNKLKEGLTEEEIFNNLKEIINNKKN